MNGSDLLSLQGLAHDPAWPKRIVLLIGHSNWFRDGLVTQVGPIRFPLGLSLQLSGMWQFMIEFPSLKVNVRLELWIVCSLFLL